MVIKRAFSRPESIYKCLKTVGCLKAHSDTSFYNENNTSNERLRVPSEIICRVVPHLGARVMVGTAKNCCYFVEFVGHAYAYMGPKMLNCVATLDCCRKLTLSGPAVQFL